MLKTWLCAVWAAALVAVVAGGGGFTVKTETDFIVALSNQSIGSVYLAANIRLTAEKWAGLTVLRTTDLSVIGSGAATTLIDFSFLSNKVTLAPGVVLKLQNLESRNGRTDIGYGIDFLTASPAATLLIVNATMFSFACLPLELVVPALRTYGRSAASAPPGAEGASVAMTSRTMQPPQQQQLSWGGDWCRCTPGIARCYNNCIGLQDVVLPVALYTGGGSNLTTGGYTLVAYNSTVVCESPVSSACGVQLGYEACVLARRKQLFEADETWSLLAAGSGDGDAGGGGLRGWPLAGAVVGALAGAALVAALLVAAVLWHRRRRGGQYAAAGALSLSSVTPPPVQGDGGVGIEIGEGSGGAPEAATGSYVAVAAAAAVPANKLGATGKTGVSSGTAQECVRTFGEPYSQQCAECPEQVPENYAEPYGETFAMQNIRSWLAEQQSSPPPPPEQQAPSIRQTA